MKKTFIIVCGGTGGHLVPGIAIAQKLQKRGHSCVLIISKKNVDKTLSANYPLLEFITIQGIGFQKNLLLIMRFTWLIFKNFCKSFLILIKKKPDAVIGFGGFTNIGPILISVLFKKKCFLHEANHVVGKTIRLLSKFADTVYLPENAIYTDKVMSKHIVHCEFPIREDFNKCDKVKAKAYFGIDPNVKLLVVTGGSQGAECLNNWVIKYADKMYTNLICLICVTGDKCANFSNIKKLKNVKFLQFCHEMNILYSAADLVVCRAGAGTIAELKYLEVPSILIPYSKSADGHQLENAKSFKKLGCCEVIEESDLDRNLLNMVLKFFNQTNLDIYNNLRKFSKNTSALNIVEDIEHKL